MQLSFMDTHLIHRLASNVRAVREFILFLQPFLRGWMNTSAEYRLENLFDLPGVSLIVREYRVPREFVYRV